MDIKKIKENAIEYIIPHWATYDSLVKEPKVFVKGE